MTAAPEIPADVMAVAEREWRAASGELINGMRGEIVVARAILAERQRCVEAVKAERIMDAYENTADADPTDIAYDMAIDHAVDAITRFSH